MADAAAKGDMFVWEGTDKAGKKVKGEMSGTSDALIKAVLRRQGINPSRVKKKPKALFSSGKKGGTKPAGSPHHQSSEDVGVLSRMSSTSAMLTRAYTHGDVRNVGEAKETNNPSNYAQQRGHKNSTSSSNMMYHRSMMNVSSRDFTSRHSFVMNTHATKQQPNPASSNNKKSVSSADLSASRNNLYKEYDIGDIKTLGRP